MDSLSQCQQFAPLLQYVQLMGAKEGHVAGDRPKLHPENVLLDCEWKGLLAHKAKQDCAAAHTTTGSLCARAPQLFS